MYRQKKLLLARIDQFKYGVNQVLDKLTNEASSSVQIQENVDNTTTNEEFEVESILNHKVKNKMRYFLVRWKGYGCSSDTWEPEKNLSCPKILQKYLKYNNLRKY